MKLNHHIYKLLHALFFPAVPDVGTFTVSREREALMRDKASPGVEQVFFEGGERIANKWHHYLEVYEHFLAPFRGKPIFFLEIGVSHGGSLELWRRYLGDSATIVGIDIEPECAHRVDAPNIVRIGSQGDPDFLRKIIAEFGAPDVILDDGSHISTHQRVSFDILFPALKDGGLYIIEDTHTSYWPSWEGGYRRNGTAIEFVKQIIDDMHGWYHGYPTKTSAKDDITAIHYYDSMIVMEKRKKQKPGFLYAQRATGVSEAI